MALAMTQPADADDGGNQDGDTFRRFEALFATELDELRRHADEHGVCLEAVSEAYFAIVGGDRPMISHQDLQDELGADGPDAWSAAQVLSDHGEVHLSRQDSWWWIMASEFVAEMCDQRSIGLKQFIEMRPDLAPFQNDVVRWYQTRHMHGNLQTRTMREIKLKHGKRLQQKYYPDKPLDPDDLHEHIVSRYLKTAQDEIVEAMNLSY